MNKLAYKKLLLKSVLIAFFSFSFLSVIAQEDVLKKQKEKAKKEKAEKKKDEQKEKEKEKIKIKGFRAGIDVSQIGYSIATKGFQAYSIYGDVMLNNKYFVVLEMGTSKIERDGDLDPFKSTNSTFNYSNSGNFFRFGIDANTISKKSDDDAVILGIRYGLANFDHDLNYTDNSSDYFGPYSRSYSKNGVNASWLELVTGAKLHFLSNFYLTTTIRIKIKTSAPASPTLDISEIPGFGTNRSSNLSINYHLLYRIPFNGKKDKKIKNLKSDG